LPVDGVARLRERRGNLLVGNTSSRNRESGVLSDAADLTIGKTTADANAFDGIQAPSGVVDAGGNKARNNGGDDCVGIVCK
jgi:hypothetical protein